MKRQAIIEIQDIIAVQNHIAQVQIPITLVNNR